MAERRMFSKSIIDSDSFIDMPTSSRLLYFDLSMRADDDGFVNSPKKIMRMTGASQDDLKMLIAKSFLIPFESGVVVIKHWKIHNYIQKDRYKETLYTEEKSLLYEKENKEYTLSTECIQVVSSMDTQVSIGEDSKDKIIKDKVNTKKFIPPTVEEVKEYCIERNNNVDAERFIDYYTSNGWKVGKNSMKDWKAAVRTWERRNDNGGYNTNNKKDAEYDPKELKYSGLIL